MTRSRTPKRSEAARSRRIAARAIAIPAAVVVVAGMTVAGTIALPDSRAGSSAPAQPVRVPAADYDTACPGPVGQAKSADSSLVFSNDASGVKQWFDAVSAPSDVLADKRPGPSSAFDVTALGSDKAGDTMLSGDAGSESSSGTVKTGEPLDSAFGLTGTVSGDKPAQVQAAQVSLASKGDLRGLSAATCGTLGSDFWIVGGSTEVGRSARLVLTNPTRTSATVNVSVYGAKGRVKTSGGGSLLVDAGSQRSVLIEGLAPDDGQVAVHVTGTGGLFSAAIEHNILRGLHPGGVDYLVPGATPSRTQYVPGISIATKAPDTKQFSDGRPVLRLANTGTDAAHASIRLFGPEGVASFSASKAVVKPGAVRDIPLDQLPKGTYSAVVTSDAPVSAAARSIRQGGPKDADFSWSPSVSPLQDEQMATIPSGVDASVVLTAVDGNAQVTLRPISTDGKLGKSTTIQLGAGITKTIDPDSLGDDTAAVLMKPVDDSSNDSGASPAKVIGGTVLTASVSGGKGISFLKIPAAPPGGSSMTVRVPR